MEYELFRCLLISGGFQWVLFYLYYDFFDFFVVMEEVSFCSYLGGVLECFSFFVSGKKYLGIYYLCCSVQLFVKMIGV